LKIRVGIALEKLKTSGKVRAVGLSLNRWQPWNGVKAVRAGLAESVQVGAQSHVLILHRQSEAEITWFSAGALALLAAVAY
jgi:aryl-alcohol dehydrogenase-like predicted oxidoreductase